MSTFKILAQEQDVPVRVFERCIVSVRAVIGQDENQLQGALGEPFARDQTLLIRRRIGHGAVAEGQDVPDPGSQSQDQTAALFRDIGGGSNPLLGEVLH